MKKCSKRERNCKLTNYSPVKEIVLRNSVREAPIMYKRKNDGWDGQLFNYI